jgi:chromosome segregation ATPase
VQIRHDSLKREIDVLEGDKRNATMLFQDLNNQIITMGKTLDSCRLECQKEKEELESLQQKRMKQEALVRQFENNNEEYNKVRKTAEEKVRSILSNKKELLRLAVFCVMETIRKDPDKYGPLIY